MMVRKLKFAAVAAISLLGLSFEAAPATAGGCWYDGCGSAVIVQPVPVYPSCSCCSCGSASYGLGYYGGYVVAMGWLWAVAMVVAMVVAITVAMVVAMGRATTVAIVAVSIVGLPMEAIVAVSIVGAPSEDIVAVSIVGPPTEDIVVVFIGGATSYS